VRFFHYLLFAAVNVRYIGPLAVPAGAEAGGMLINCGITVYNFYIERMTM